MTARFRCSLLGLLLLSVLAVSVGAQHDALPTIDTSIETVITRGRWAAGDTSGSYRVIELAQGWESIRRRVIVQWLEEDADAQETVVRAAVDLGTILTDAFSVSDPVLTWQGARWQLAVRTSDRPMAQPTGRVLFALGPPGIVRRLRSR